MASPIVYSWAKFFHGLIAAAINATASSLVVAMVDPQDFNIWDGRAKLGAVAAASAFFGVITYLKNTQLPDFFYDPEKAK